jgi:hypothetical protein
VGICHWRERSRFRDAEGSGEFTYLKRSSVVRGTGMIKGEVYNL